MLIDRDQVAELHMKVEDLSKEIQGLHDDLTDMYDLEQANLYLQRERDALESFLRELGIDPYSSYSVWQVSQMRQAIAEIL